VEPSPVRVQEQLSDGECDRIHRSACFTFVARSPSPSCGQLRRDRHASCTRKLVQSGGDQMIPGPSCVLRSARLRTGDERDALALRCTEQ